MNIEQIIKEHSLVVRCLPDKVISVYKYREGDILSNDEEIIDKEGRKFIKRTKLVENAGLWIVKQAKNTDSTIQFSLKRDFTGNTLEEAITLFLNSKKDEH